jgi:hypothetical protein
MELEGNSVKEFVPSYTVSAPGLSCLISGNLS